MQETWETCSVLEWQQPLIPIQWRWPIRAYINRVARVLCIFSHATNPRTSRPDGLSWAAPPTVCKVSFVLRTLLTEVISGRGSLLMPTPSPFMVHRPHQRKWSMSSRVTILEILNQAGLKLLSFIQRLTRLILVGDYPSAAIH